MTSPPAAHPATARGLIGDASGRWLLVLPWHDPRWLLPGGLVEHNESPAQACHREICEELGIALTPGRLLSVGWHAPRRPGRRARYSFVFDMGTHDAERVSVLIHDAVPCGTRGARELAGWRWVPPDEALTLLHPALSAQLTSRPVSAGATYVEQL